VSELRFEWHPKKSASKRREHGVSFEEAVAVFYDDRALLIADPDHSDDEDRFVPLGLSSALRLLVVCHCDREDDEIIRIISARKATASERQQYIDRWQS